jgi:catechol 2,3-dioxygenase-like lactoylglutathione lyase family enzyme
MPNARARRIDHLVLNCADVGAARAFYVEALGFAEAGDWLSLGEQRLRLASAGDSAPYPRPRAANDPWFQHVAIVVSDMAAAYARLRRFGEMPISRGGPQQLPPSTGGVIAYKFRDPEGHPLELSFIPGSAAWSAVAKARPGAVFLGIDHTAVAALDLDAAVASYRDLGFSEGPRFLNTGPEQDRLDGLDGVVLDIATMMAPDGGPHIELLHYRSPRPVAPMPDAPPAVAATRTVFAREGGGEIARVMADLNRP